MDNKLFLKAKERAESRMKVLDSMTDFDTAEGLREQILDQYVDYEYTIDALKEELRQFDQRRAERWGYYE